jgi:hypothetical protein
LAVGGDRPPPPWRTVKDKAYLGSQVAPSRWLRPTCYLDGYPGLLWGDLEGGRGPRASSVFCCQAQEVHEAFTLLRVEVRDWPTLQRQRGAIVLPVSTLATLWTGSWWQVRWRTVFFCPVSHLVALEAGPGGVCCCPAHLEVGGGGLRAAAKSWAFHWSQASSQLLNTLSAIFTRSPCGGWGPFSACLSFLRISGKDWEIKWELRIIIPSLEDGSHAKPYHMLGSGI